MKYEMKTLIPNMNESPFEDLGLTERDFVPIEDLVDKDIVVTAYKKYSKDDSPGVFIAFEADGIAGYVATHAVALVKTFDEQAVRNVLDGGESIEACIVKRTSKKTGRQYYCFKN